MLHNITVKLFESWAFGNWDGLIGSGFIEGHQHPARETHGGHQRVHWQERRLQCGNIPLQIIIKEITC